MSPNVAYTLRTQIYKEALLSLIEESKEREKIGDKIGAEKYREHIKTASIRAGIF